MRSLFVLALGLVLALAPHAEASPLIVKDLLTDPANYIDGSLENFGFSSGIPGNVSSKRAYIAVTPTEDGILSEVSLAVSFDQGIEVPNNNPSSDPFDVGVGFFSDLPGVSEDPEKIDTVIEFPTLDTANPLGTIEGFDVFKLTVDLSSQNWIVTAGTTYYISLHAQNAAPSETPFLHNSEALGAVTGAEPDYIFFGYIGGPFLLSTWPEPGEMFAASVTIEIEDAPTCSEEQIDRCPRIHRRIARVREILERSDLPRWLRRFFNRVLARLEPREEWCGECGL